MTRYKALTLPIAAMLILTIPVGRLVLGGEAKITHDVIVLETPKRKQGGKETAITFPHKKHAEEQAKGDCSVCHPPVPQALDSPDLTMAVGHKVCRSCHKKGQVAEKRSTCKSCHKPKT